MRTAIGYLRVSTLDQAREGVSLAAQEAKIRAWAVANDYKVAAVCQDAGLSGGRADNRPALQEALQGAKDGMALVVYSLSRLARSTKDAIAISDRLVKAGADLVSLSEKIDTTSASGKMIFRLMAVLAEFERDQIAERTKMAMAHLQRQGLRVGHPPFGWDIGLDGRTLKANDREQRAIRLMERQRKAGAPFDKIARGLESNGYRTKAGGHRWYPAGVRSILIAVQRNAELAKARR